MEFATKNLAGVDQATSSRGLDASTGNVLPASGITPGSSASSADQYLPLKRGKPLHTQRTDPRIDAQLPHRMEAIRAFGQMHADSAMAIADHAKDMKHSTIVVFRIVRLKT